VQETSDAGRAGGVVNGFGNAHGMEPRRPVQIDDGHLGDSRWDFNGDFVLVRSRVERQFDFDDSA